MCNVKRRIQGNEIMEKTGTGNKTTPMNTDLMFRAVNYDKWTYTLQTHMHARARTHTHMHTRVYFVSVPRISSTLATSHVCRLKGHDLRTQGL